MLKKVLVFLLLFSLVGSTVNNSSSASFFKNFRKNKTVDKQNNIDEASKKTEEKKILLVEIFASWCPGCKNIQPILDQLIKENAEIEIIKLDVSTPSKAKASAQQAQSLKITDFYNVNKSKTATVAVFVPTTLEVVSVFQNNSDIEEYKVAIGEAKSREQALKEQPSDLN